MIGHRQSVTKPVSSLGDGVRQEDPGSKDVTDQRHGPRHRIPVNVATVFALLLMGGLMSLAAEHEHDKEPPTMSPEAKPAAHDERVFRPDPSYADKPYDPKEQWEIYGGKHLNPTARPLLELGRELYKSGPLNPGFNLVGRKNLLFPYLYVYGDWRSAVAFNDNGANEQWTAATRLNLDIDVKLTATERVHVFMRPLDKNGKFTRWDFAEQIEDELEVQLDGNPDAAFFEGDLGAILAGATDQDNKLDLPFAVGLMPLLFQNGIWVEDAFTGFAATIPARNNRWLGIANMDVTFFVGLDKVTTRGVVNSGGDLSDDRAHIWGLTTFIEANQGYWEAGYGFTDSTGSLDDQSYNNLALAFTRRYGGRLSNSVRGIWNLGQDRDGAQQTADGWLLLVENSLVSPKPLTIVPYCNLFFGRDRPQSLARDAGAGGVLKNTGILFETDGLTGYPKMDDTAQDTFGGALGLEYLFNLDRQIVVETAVVKDAGGDNNTRGDQLGLGLRYQQPLTNAWILRGDVMTAFREKDDDLFGARFELRRKF